MTGRAAARDWIGSGTQAPAGEGSDRDGARVGLGLVTGSSYLAVACCGHRGLGGSTRKQSKPLPPYTFIAYSVSSIGPSRTTVADTFEHCW
jgi:hypothetical protein